MDVIVTWKDGSKNCVNTKDLRPVRKHQHIKLGTEVKMFYDSKWYYGTVTVIETKKGDLAYFPTAIAASSDSNSSEDVPLSSFCKLPHEQQSNCKEQTNATCQSSNDDGLIINNIIIELSLEDEEKPIIEDRELNKVEEATVIDSLKNTSVEIKNVNDVTGIMKDSTCENLDELMKDNNNDILVHNKNTETKKLITQESQFAKNINCDEKSEVRDSETIDNHPQNESLTCSSEMQIQDISDQSISLVAAMTVDVFNEEDEVIPLSRFAKTFTKSLEAEKDAQNRDQLIRISRKRVTNEEYEDAETCCPSDRSSPQLFGDISNVDDPDYVPECPRYVNLPKTKKRASDCYAIQSCEVDDCHQEVFSSCCRCSALLCWVHFEQNNADCIQHKIQKTKRKLKDDILESPHTIKLPKNKGSASDCFVPQSCEVDDCHEEVFSSCFRCSALLCWVHFEQDNTDCEHHKVQNAERTFKDILLQNAAIYDNFLPMSCEVIDCGNETYGKCHRCSDILCIQHFEEDKHICAKRVILQDHQNFDNLYELDGSNREFDMEKKKKENKGRLQKKLRNTGQEYLNYRTKKIVPAKQLGSFCNIEFCKKMNRFCGDFSDLHRQDIHTQFYQLGDVDKQREFVARHVVETTPAQRTTRDISRRKRSLHYYFTKKGKKVKVCRKFFLSTLAISEKIVRTSLDKINKATGILEKDHRGGRREKKVLRDSVLRSVVEEHIRRFPRVESHYCRINSTREYLHPDLTRKKMHRLLLEEQPEHAPSLSLYKKVFNEMNLSFHHPKKDQCSLCAAYKSGTSEEKEKLQEKYTAHAIEKETVRTHKKNDKKKAEEDKSFICATFDLQQVIFLPMSKESAIFYKRRLSVYNLTMYDLASRNCICYVWPETESRRGSSEISTALILYLQEYDKDGVKAASLYADGCAGQNKNSIVASALLRFINESKNIQTVSLKYFAPNHGQNEGDSAHSAISYALTKAGDVFQHTQLYPIINMARPAQPYKVHPLEYTDFKDFKQFSKKIKLLTLRKDNENNVNINWTDIAELKVEKQHPASIFFKTSHAEDSYRSLTLKRTEIKHLTDEIPALNQSRVKISSGKYQDLMNLCTGNNPVIRLEEHKKYYESLPHE